MLRNALFVLLLTFVSFISSAQTDLLDKRKSLPCVDKEFTIVGHLVRDTFGVLGTSPATVAEAVDQLNLWFDPICVSFNLAALDTIDNFQYDEPRNNNEVEQMWTNHNADNRINVYFINNTNFLTYEPAYAEFEGILNPGRGGILISNFAINNAPLWLVHAFGHYCGLLNTNEDFGTELVNGSNCETAGDSICDTPADPQNPNVPGRGIDIYVDGNCKFIYNTTDPNGDHYLTQTGNVMSYYPDICWCGFTNQQFERMADFLERSPLW